MARDLPDYGNILSVERGLLLIGNSAKAIPARFPTRGVSVINTFFGLIGLKWPSENVSHYLCTTNGKKIRSVFLVM